MGNPASWCANSWCYVDECDCNDPAAAPSVYFSYTDEATSQAKNPYYSYATCDAEDLFTTEETNANKDAERQCNTEQASGAYMPGMVPLTMFVVVLLPVFRK